MVAALDDLQAGAEHRAVERGGRLADAAAVGRRELAVYNRIGRLVAFVTPGRAHHGEIGERLARLHARAVDRGHGARHVVVAVCRVCGGGAVGAELFEVLTQIVGGNAARRDRDGDLHRAAAGSLDLGLHIGREGVEIHGDAVCAVGNVKLLRSGIEGRDGSILRFRVERSGHRLERGAQGGLAHLRGEGIFHRRLLERRHLFIALLARAGAAVFIRCFQHRVRVHAVVHVVLCDGEALIVVGECDAEGLLRVLLLRREGLACLVHCHAAEIDAVHDHAVIEGVHVEHGGNLCLIRLLLLALAPFHHAEHGGRGGDHHHHGRNRDDDALFALLLFILCSSRISAVHVGGRGSVSFVCHCNPPETTRRGCPGLTAGSKSFIS